MRNRCLHEPIRTSPVPIWVCRNHAFRDTRPPTDGKYYCRRLAAARPSWRSCSPVMGVPPQFPVAVAVLRRRAPYSVSPRAWPLISKRNVPRCASQLSCSSGKGNSPTVMAFRHPDVVLAVLLPTAQRWRAVLKSRLPCRFQTRPRSVSRPFSLRITKYVHHMLASNSLAFSTLRIPISTFSNCPSTWATVWP